MTLVMARHQTRRRVSKAEHNKAEAGKHGEVCSFPSTLVGYLSKVAVPSWNSFGDSVIGTGGVSPASQSRFERLSQIKPPALPGDIYSSCFALSRTASPSPLCNWPG